MATLTLNGFNYLGNQLQQLLMCDDIMPGAQPGYEICKVIYSYHPHGAKLADFPIQMAQHKPRKITVPKAPDDGAMMVEAFEAKWKAIAADRSIFNLGRLSRVYGVSTLGLVVKGEDAKTEVDLRKLGTKQFAFNVWDPLNTAGSLVLNQDPNALDFQKVQGVRVNGKAYHRSRTCVLMNEDPLYILYETAGFGFLGRSIYQRGLTPLKSFIYTLATDMMIALKAGVLVAKMKSQSSAVDSPMQWLFGQKRSMVKEAQTGNVLSIDVEEEIESLNLQNLDGAYGMARKNILENEAAACGTPAKIVLAETFAEGFGEGTEDAKAVAQFVETIRFWLQPAYDFFDNICMYLAWDEDFYRVVQQRYPEEYGGVSYTAAFQEWRNSFTAIWPSLLDEPESEKLKGEDVVLKAILAVVEILLPEVPGDVKAEVIEWLCNCINEKKRLFSSPLELDYQAIADYEPPQPEQGFGPPAPESSRDSDVPRFRAARPGREALDRLDTDVRRRAFAALRTVQGQGVAEAV